MSELKDDIFEATLRAAALDVWNWEERKKRRVKAVKKITGAVCACAAAVLAAVGLYVWREPLRRQEFTQDEPQITLGETGSSETFADELPDDVVIVSPASGTASVSRIRYSQAAASVTPNSTYMYLYTDDPKPVSESAVKQKIKEFMRDDFNEKALADDYVRAHERSGIEIPKQPEPCENHSFLEHKKWVRSYINFTNYHITVIGHYKRCSECGAVELGEVEHEIDEHKFRCWTWSGREDFIGGEHRFWYEANCTECHIYCRRAVLLPGGGENDGAYVDDVGVIRYTDTSGQARTIDLNQTETPDITFDAFPLDGLTVTPATDGADGTMEHGGEKVIYGKNEIPIFINDSVLTGVFGRISDGRVCIPVKLYNEIYGEEIKPDDDLSYVDLAELPERSDITVNYHDGASGIDAQMLPGIEHIRVTICPGEDRYSSSEAANLISENLILAYNNIYGNKYGEYRASDVPTALPEDKNSLAYAQYVITWKEVRICDGLIFVVSPPLSDTGYDMILALSEATGAIYSVGGEGGVTFELFDPSSPDALPNYG